MKRPMTLRIRTDGTRLTIEADLTTPLATVIEALRALCVLMETTDTFTQEGETTPDDCPLLNELLSRKG